MSSINKVKEFNIEIDDIVYRFDKRRKIRFGVVVDAYDEPYGISELQKGKIRVWWANSCRESVLEQNKVRLMSRSITIGDTVRRIENGTETQRGYCKEAKQLATVQIVGTDKIIERVTSERLNAVPQFHKFDLVCLDNKYGKIRGIDQKVKMQSKCGSTVEIFSSINRKVEDKKNEYNYFDIIYYPGQEVICTPNNLEQPQWLQCSKAMKRSMHTRQTFIVQKVENLQIKVRWYDSMSSTHLEHIKTEDAPRLKVVKNAGSDLELAQSRPLQLNFSDVLLKKKDWIRKQSVLHQPKHHKVLHIVNRTSKKHKVPKLRRPSLLATCVTITDSEEGWYTEEDEEEMSNNGSSSRTTSNTRLNTKHFPPELSELVPGNTVAVEILCTDSKATIVWQDGTEEKDIPTTLLNSYISLELYAYEFFPGEWVISDGKTEKYGTVQHVNHLERTVTVKWFTHKEGNEKPQLVSENEMSVYDIKKHPKYAFSPGSVVKKIPIENDKCGTVLDSCPEGYVIVQWINGVQENCWPQNLELADSLDLDFSTTDSEDNAGDHTGETILQKLVAGIDSVLMGSKNPEKENISKVFKLKLEHILTDIGKDRKDVSKEAGEPSVVTTPDSECTSIADDNICVELLSMMKGSSTSCENEVFTILDEAHISHHFYSSKLHPTDKQKFVKTVQKEYKVLEESLPPGVWVRSYGNRMDLLSVMIEGPKNTPYEDGLFLFDLQLSQDYPLSPPRCHYISYSAEQLNPNLNVGGEVCTSLLGTWLGRGTEMWNTNSTLLQLIVSIQGLILVAEPYYNEPGHEKQVNSQQGYEKSRTYNELVILTLVQSMKELALAPPQVFAGEIAAYYATHGEKMCNRLERWCDDSDPLKPKFPLLPVSKGLKLSLTFALKTFKDVLRKTNLLCI